MVSVKRVMYYGHGLIFFGELLKWFGMAKGSDKRNIKSVLVFAMVDALMHTVLLCFPCSSQPCCWIHDRVALTDHHMGNA